MPNGENLRADRGSDEVLNRRGMTGSKGDVRLRQKGPTSRSQNPSGGHGSVGCLASSRKGHKARTAYTYTVVTWYGSTTI